MDINILHSKTQFYLIKNKWIGYLCTVFLILLMLLPSPVRCQQPILLGIEPNSILYTSGEVFVLTGQGFSPDDKIVLIGSSPKIIEQKPAIDPNKKEANITGIHIQDTYAYIIEDSSTLHILDIGKPDQPRLIGSLTDERFVNLKKIWATQSLLYLTDTGYGIWVVNISDPNKPSLMKYKDGVCSFDAPSTFGLYVKGEFIYSTNPEAGLQILEQQFPNGCIIERGRKRMFDDQTPYDVFVKGDLAYVATGATVQIFNVSNPGNPDYISQIDHIPSGSSNIHRLLIRDNTLYIGDRLYGIHIADLSTPTDPQIISSLKLKGETIDICLRGPYALVANSFHGLQIIDLHEEEKPSIFGNIYTFGNATNISSYGYYIYIANGYAGLSIVEAPSLVHPNLQTYKNTQDNIWAITSQDGYAYVSNGESGLKVFQTYPTWNPNVSKIQTDHLATYSFVKEDMLYLADTTKLKAYDISNILAPKWNGTFDFQDTIMSIFVQAEYAYLANLWFGAQSVKIANPSKMEQEGFIFSGGLAYDILVDQNRLAYLANDQEGLWIVDFRNPSDPNELSKLAEFKFAHSLKKYTNYIYMTNGSHGIEIIDVSDSNTPTYIETIDYTNFLKGIGIDSPFNDFLKEIDIEFPFLYTAGDYQGIWINYLSEDGEVTPIDVINLPYGTNAVKSDGDLIYFGDDYGNFYIFSSPMQAQIVTKPSYDQIKFRIHRDLSAGSYDIFLIRKSEGVFKLDRTLKIYQNKVTIYPGLNILSYPGLVPFENEQAFSLLRNLEDQGKGNNLRIQNIMWMKKTDSESESFLIAYMDQGNQPAGDNFDILPLKSYPIYANGTQKKEYFLASHPLNITEAELIKRLKSEITSGRNLISLPVIKDILIKSSDLINSESQIASGSIREWDANHGKWNSGYRFFNTVNGKVKNLIGGHGYLVSIP